MIELEDRVREGGAQLEATNDRFVACSNDFPPRSLVVDSDCSASVSIPRAWYTRMASKVTHPCTHMIMQAGEHRSKARRAPRPFTGAGLKHDTFCHCPQSAVLTAPSRA